MSGERQFGATHGDAQFHDTAVVHRLAGDDRHAELFLQFGGVDGHSGTAREVHHVEHHDHGPAEIEDLVGEIEVPLEVGRVEHADDTVGLRCIGAATEQHVSGDGLVG